MPENLALEPMLYRRRYFAKYLHTLAYYRISSPFLDATAQPPAE